MGTAIDSGTPRLPGPVEEILARVVDAAQRSFGDDLRSVVLYGSAAEGRMRATSDVNVLLVLRRFDRERVDLFREPMRLAQVAAGVVLMFLLEGEIADAAEAFAVKFADIARRRRVLHGEDVFAKLVASRAAQVARLRQMLLNLTLRLRSRYALVSLREEKLALVMADLAGPLRAAAATLLELEGRGARAPREALLEVAREIGGEWDAVLERLSMARETRALPAGTAVQSVFALMDLTEKMRLRAQALS
jgi:predicted nucleotidyltransferase